MSLLSFLIPSDSCEDLGRVCLLDLGRRTPPPPLLPIVSESTQTLFLEGQGGMNRHKKEGDNVPGWLP